MASFLRRYSVASDPWEETDEKISGRSNCWRNRILSKAYPSLPDGVILVEHIVQYQIRLGSGVSSCTCKILILNSMQSICIFY